MRTELRQWVIGQLKVVMYPPQAHALTPTVREASRGVAGPLCQARTQHLVGKPRSNFLRMSTNFGHLQARLEMIASPRLSTFRASWLRDTVIPFMVFRSARSD
jgi:hypothetical protein